MKTGVELLSDVTRIAQKATAHNSGQTILHNGVNTGGNQASLTMSSWPRMQEARKALEAHGYTCDEVQIPMANTLLVMGPASRRTPVDRSRREVEAWLAG